MIPLPKEGLNKALDEIEENWVIQALIATDYNKTQAAKLLKIQRTTLIQKLRRFNLWELIDEPTNKKTRSMKPDGK